MESLTSPASFQQRLTYAGLALAGLRVDGLLPELAVRATVLERAFCRWPDCLNAGDVVLTGRREAAIAEMVPEEGVTGVLALLRSAKAHFLAIGTLSAQQLPSTEALQLMHFMYCGGMSKANRVYVDAATGETFR